MDCITIETDARGVATLTLNTADKHNVLSKQLVSELSQAAVELAADDSVRVVILAAKGTSFCAGVDLGWIKEQMSATREVRMAEARSIADMLFALNTLPKPLIGKIEGLVYGGGVGLAAVCDVVIAVEGARFALSETRLGLIPATISPYVLARLGESMARRVFMSSRVFEAAEAKVLGLITKSVMPEYIDLAIEAEVKPYLSAAPSAVASAKALVRSLGPVIDDAVIDRTIEALADTWETPAAMEGVSAFFEKRKPSWMN